MKKNREKIPKRAQEKADELTANVLHFRKYNGEAIEDIHTYVKEWTEENPYGSVIVGCDSQEHTTYIKYAVTIVMHRRDESGLGHGGHVIFATIIDKSKNMKSDVYTKLWAETEVTIKVAKEIGEIDKKITIHLDYNSDENAYSNILFNAGIGKALESGFDAQGKPFAYAASHTADKIAKNSSKR